MMMMLLMGLAEEGHDRSETAEDGAARKEERRRMMGMTKEQLTHALLLDPDFRLRCSPLRVKEDGGESCLFECRSDGYYDDDDDSGGAAANDESRVWDTFARGLQHRPWNADMYVRISLVISSTIECALETVATPTRDAVLAAERAFFEVRACGYYYYYYYY